MKRLPVEFVDVGGIFKVELLLLLQKLKVGEPGVLAPAIEVIF